MSVSPTRSLALYKHVGRGVCPGQAGVRVPAAVQRAVDTRSGCPPKSGGVLLSKSFTITAHQPAAGLTCLRPRQGGRRRSIVDSHQYFCLSLVACSVHFKFEGHCSLMGAPAHHHARAGALRLTCAGRMAPPDRGRLDMPVGRCCGTIVLEQSGRAARKARKKHKKQVPASPNDARGDSTSQKSPAPIVSSHCQIAKNEF